MGFQIQIFGIYFCQKSKFLSKIQNFAENQNFCRKPKFLSKTQIFIENFCQNFCQIFVKIPNFRVKLNLDWWEYFLSILKSNTNRPNEHIRSKILGNFLHVKIVHFLWKRVIIDKIILCKIFRLFFGLYMFEPYTWHFFSIFWAWKNSVNIPKQPFCITQKRKLELFILVILIIINLLIENFRRKSKKVESFDYEQQPGIFYQYFQIIFLHSSKISFYTNNFFLVEQIWITSWVWPMANI